MVVLAVIAIFNVWAFYTESPWTRDAKFTADVVAIAPDVSGLLTEVPVKDNQLVQKGQILFVIDQPRYQQALAEAEADVAYYQTLAAEKQRSPVGGTAWVFKHCHKKRLTRQAMCYKPSSTSWQKPLPCEI